MFASQGGIQASDAATLWEDQWVALLSWLSGLKRGGRKALLALDNAEDAIPAGAAPVSTKHLACKYHATMSHMR